MPNIKSNTITYIFEGDTLNLEQAIKRVQSLMRGTVKTLREQEGGMSEVQKAQYKQLQSLMKTIKELNSKTSKLTKDEQKKLNTAMNKALSISNSLYKAKLREKDKIRKQELTREKKEKYKAEKLNADIEAARTPEAQVRAHSQLQQLSRLKGFMNTGDPVEAEALRSLEAVISEYEKAKAAYDAGTGSMERLATATVRLNNKYRELASSLNRLSSEQNKANHGEGKSSFIQFLLGKTKSLAVYKLIKAVIAKITQMLNTAFQKMALISNSFNDAMTRLTSSFQLIADKIAAALGPIIQLITPFIEYLSQALGEILDKINQMFNAVAGNDAWIEARYQVEDYAAAVRKANSTQGIDELNKINTQQNNMVEVKLEGMENLKAVGEVLKNVLAIIQAAIDPLVNILVPVLGQIATLIGAISTSLEPLLSLVTTIITFLSSALGGVLGVLIDNILGPIIDFLATMISHLELLIPLAASFLLLWAMFNWNKVIIGLSTMVLQFKALSLKISAAIIAAKNWIITSLKTVAMNIKNAVSAWIAEKAYWKLALAAIAAAGMLAAVVAGIVMTAVASASSVVDSNESNGPDTVAMATGGVVSAPTLAMVGEGKYPEAVVPLGQSPQFTSMKQGIAEEVVSLIGPRNDARNNRPVVLNIDGRTLARALWPDLIDTQYQVGVKLK